MDKKLVVLIVDDSVEDRVACRRYLRQDPDWRYEVLETTTASGALEICQEKRPDCILLDYRLPDMDGLEVLASLARSSAGEGIARCHVDRCG
jgi:CheY-like chemotaxis protein